QKGDLAAARGEMQEASRLLKLKQDQEAAATAVSNGRQRLKEGKTAEALLQSQNATRLAPEMAEAWELLGEALRKSGKLAEARQANERAKALRTPR
ncbi:MAG: hypothetical protein RIR86_531, partial [Acidobacteriota bacterium]